MNGTGCVQSQDCIDCLTQSGVYKPANDTNSDDKGNAVCPFDCSGACVNDGLVSSQILKWFEQVTSEENKDTQQPFFIGVGLKRPHLPFDAPQEYYDMYNPKDIAIAKHNRPPYNMPIKATNNVSEIKNYNDVNASLEFIDYEWENKSYKIALVNDSYQRNLRSAYYSAVSFMDHEFGKIIQGLYEYDLWDNTIITITGIYMQLYLKLIAHYNGI